MMATGVIVVFVVVVSLVQAARPKSEVGDAGVFALSVAAVGAITMFVANAIVKRFEKRSTRGTAASASSIREG